MLCAIVCVKRSHCNDSDYISSESCQNALKLAGKNFLSKFHRNQSKLPANGSAIRLRSVQLQVLHKKNAERVAINSEIRLFTREFWWDCLCVPVSPRISCECTLIAVSSSQCSSMQKRIIRCESFLCFDSAFEIKYIHICMCIIISYECV